MRRLAAAAACALGLLLGPPAEAQKRDLVIGITQFPSNFHPSIDAMLAKSYIEGMTLRPLTTFDADWELICMLCVELPTLENGGAVRRPREGENGADAVSMTYRLRPEATWGDGTPVTSDDVVFAWEVGKHPQSGIGNAELYRDITGIDVIDDKTFVLHVRELGYNYNAVNDLRPLPAHLDREIFEADPASYRSRTLFDRDPTNPGLAYGPYRLTEVEIGAYVVLEPNPTWWGDPPFFDRIVVRAIENTAALEANLLSGQLDMIAGELGLSIDQAMAFEQRHADRFQVVYKPGLIYEHVDLMLDNPVLADPRVRQALMYSLDREAMVSQLFGGHQPVAATNVSPLDTMHADEVATYTYDPERAAALFEEAGWGEIMGGIRHNADGEALQVELMTTAGNRLRELVQQVLQGQLRQAGVDVRIRNQPPRVLFGETLTKRKFDGMVMFAWVSSPQNAPRTTLHSEEVPSEANGWSGQNYGGYRNPRVDELLDELATLLDEEPRRAIWAELQQIYARDLPALPLYFRADAHVWPVWLEGVVPTGHQYPSTLWVEDWHAAPAG